uniref:Reverse transcriptase domain-containing protein n=1 Tax=Elaeophora elaphi TaxID=1147741 RepID=A0A0R3RKB8_9BILA
TEGKGAEGNKGDEQVGFGQSTSRHSKLEASPSPLVLIITSRVSRGTGDGEGAGQEGSTATDVTEAAEMEGAEGMGKEGIEGSERGEGAKGAEGIGKEKVEGAGKEGLGYTRSERRKEMSSSLAPEEQLGLGQQSLPYSKVKASSSPIIAMMTSQISSGIGDQEGTAKEGTDERVGAGLLISTTDITMPERLHGASRAKLIETGKEERYGADETHSVSETVSKTVKFKGIRSNVANRTDSSDIYIGGHLLTPKPTWSSELGLARRVYMISDRDASIVWKRIGHWRFEQMNQTLKKSMNISKSVARHESMFIDSKSNFTEVADIKLKKMEIAKSKSTMKQSAIYGEEVNVSRSDAANIISRNRMMKEFDHNVSKTPVSLQELIDVAAHKVRFQLSNKSSLEERSSSSEYIEEIRHGWQEALEVLREQLRSFEDKTELAVRESHKMATVQNRKMNITYLLSSGDEMSAKELKSRLLSAGWYVNSSGGYYIGQKNETRTNSNEYMMKSGKKTVENSWRNSWHWTYGSVGSATKLMEMRRKMLEARKRNGTLTKGMNLSTSAGKLQEMKASQEKRWESKQEELMFVRSLEQKARLEEARLLREEQMELRKQQELQHGFIDKTQRARHEEITSRLEQLAEKERKYSEDLERMERIKLKLTMTPSPNNHKLSRTSIDISKDLLPATRCSTVKKFIRIFAVGNPVKWIREHCSVVKMYFPKESCESVQNTFKSCFQ